MDKKKKTYSPPTLTQVTPEQARKRVADGKTCSEEEAAIAFLKSLSQQNEKKQNKQPQSNGRDQKQERLA
jgi:hypothetical protein